MTKVYKTTFKLRRGTAEEWSKINPILAAGEPGFEIDTFGLKIGDGESRYSDLPYMSGDDNSSVINKPTKADFPEVGDPNVIYKAEKEGQIYQWNSEGLAYEPLGTTAETALNVDGTSLIYENNLLQIFGFNAAEIGTTPVKDESGKLTWVKSEIKVVESLEQTVGSKEEKTGLAGDIVNLQTIIGTPSTSTSIATGLIGQIEAKADASKVYTKEETDERIANAVANIDRLERKIINSIDEIDVSAVGVENIIFMVPAETAQEHDGYDEYMVINGQIEKVGSWEVDLSNYVTEDSFNSLKNLVEGKISTSKAQAYFERVKYEIFSKPKGTLVSHRDGEIRVLCPEDTEWTKQNVGPTGNANMYYMGFRAYAPEGAVSFKEGDKGVVEDKMFTFDGEFAGTDEFGRNYSIVWLALASYNEISGQWTYYGASSTAKKFIGWTYIVEWYDENGIQIDSDMVRINLANESCYNLIEPYYVLERQQEPSGNAIGISIGGNLMEAINGIIDIPVATEEQLGVVKSSTGPNRVKINEDGTMEVETIDFSRVVTSEGADEVILGGGNAAD
jgi:hypothetical protein